MKRLLFTGLIISILSGCISTPPNPGIQVQVAGDEQNSCTVIDTDLQQAQQAFDEAHSAHNWQVGSNIALGVTGALILIPLFFIDTGHGHSVDMQNAQARINHLATVKAAKGCR